VRRALQATTASVVFALTISASAEPSSARTANAEADTARREAEKLLRARDVPRACAKLAESVELSPRLTTRLALARCHVAEKRYALATDELEGVAAQAAKEGNRALAKAARADAAFARARTGRVLLSLSPEAQSTEGLDVRVASTPVAPGDLDKPKRMDPGVVTIEAVAPHRKPWSTEQQVVAGKDTVVAVPALEEESTTAPPAAMLSLVVPDHAADIPPKTSGEPPAPPRFNASVDTTGLVFHDPVGRDGRMLISMLRVGYWVHPTTEIFARSGIVWSSLPSGDGATNATNPALGVNRNFALSKQWMLIAGAATTIPVGSGGGADFDPAARQTNQTAVVFVGPALEPNFLALIPGFGVQWNPAPFRFRVREDVVYMIRTRGEAVEPDATQLRSISRARSSVQLGVMQIYAEATYGRFLIEPYFIPKVPDAIDSLVATVAVAATFRPFTVEAGYSRPLDLPQRRGDYNLANLLVGVIY
jgi:hypothetical protein